MEDWICDTQCPYGCTPNRCEHRPAPRRRASNCGEVVGNGPCPKCGGKFVDYLHGPNGFVKSCGHDPPPEKT